MPIATSTDEFVRYNVNGIDYDFSMPVDSVWADSLVETPYFIPDNKIFASRISSPSVNSVRIEYEKNGIIAGSSHNLKLFYTTQTGLFPYSTTSMNTVLVNITEYGNVGQYIAGNFTNQFIGPAPGNILYNVICSFRVKRKI